MAYKGLVGLIGKPEQEVENYTVLPVLDYPDITAYLHQDVFDFIKTHKPSPEGDHLFFVEGMGRLRFQIVSTAQIASEEKRDGM